MMTYFKGVDLLIEFCQGRDLKQLMDEERLVEEFAKRKAAGVFDKQTKWSLN